MKKEKTVRAWAESAWNQSFSPGGMAYIQYNAAVRAETLYAVLGDRSIADRCRDRANRLLSQNVVTWRVAGSELSDKRWKIAC